MIKDFFEVFPKLKLSDDLAATLSGSQVTRVATNPQHSAIRITLSCGRLIPKESVYAVERELSRQFFARQHVAVHIAEDFHLSAQYTLPNLMEAYWPSILTEFHEYSLVEYNLLLHAGTECPDETSIVVTLEDSFVAKQKEEEIYLILDKILHERFHMDVTLTVRFEKAAESKYRKDAEITMQHEVEDIISHSALAGRKPNDMDGNDGKPVEYMQGGDDSEVPWDTGDKVSVKLSTDTTGPADHNNAKSIDRSPGSTKGSESGELSAAAASKPQAKANSAIKSKSAAKKNYTRGSYKSSDPDMIYGRSFDDDPIPIEQIQGEMGEVTIRGQVMSTDSHGIRGEKTILKLSVTDFTDSIAVKLFCKNEDFPEIEKSTKAGTFLKIKGVTSQDSFDHELTIGTVHGMKKIPSFKEERRDNSPRKRVELHCHTKMSDMDGVSDVKDIINTAMGWGHKAIAITDHGDVQAFTDAIKGLPKGTDFQVIYGMEAYLVDDLRTPVSHSGGQSLNDSYVVFDLETTGFSAEKNKIIEIGAVRVEEGKVTDRFSTFVNPKVPIPYDIEQLTGIKDEMVISAPTIEEILPQFMDFCEGAVMVAHNADFDMSFIKKDFDDLGLPCGKTVVDTVALSRMLLPQLSRFKLDTVARALHVNLGNHHRAVDDAECTAYIFIKLAQMLAARDIFTLDELDEKAEPDEAEIKKLPYYHAIILAKNEIGRVNLYRLVSSSHLKYFARRPRVPKSELIKHREGLILGSACEAGELYRAILNGRTEEAITQIADFYDILEIQPLGNNAFM
ncbi:MAG: PHP domain-containing protein, partial [Clostridiales bacterium]|nr:PHP domain-containing protein [Clostridiales bacterium]